MFKYEEYQLNGYLSLFIKKIWTLDNLDNQSDVLNKSILPNGCFNIAIIEGTGFKVTQKGIDTLLKPGVYFCGQATEAVAVDIFHHSKAIMVQVYPWVPVYFTRSDISKLTDMIIPLDELGFKELHGRNFQSFLADSYPVLSNYHIVRAFKAYFAVLLKLGPIASLIKDSTQRILELNGNITVKEISYTSGCSERHLQKIFKTHIGLSPKQFINIIRLREAVDDIAYPELESRSLSQLALVNNFYDQAHFNKSFMTVVKTSPKKFKKYHYLLSFKK